MTAIVTRLETLVRGFVSDPAWRIGIIAMGTFNAGRFVESGCGRTSLVGATIITALIVFGIYCIFERRP